MGAWVGLGANYPPGTLTPATAFVVALGHLEGATSVYVDDDHDVLTRAERYLGQIPIEPFLNRRGYPTLSAAGGADEEATGGEGVSVAV